MNIESNHRERSVSANALARLQTIRDLSYTSARSYRDPDSAIDWDLGGGPDPWFKSPESVALYGTQFWDLLGEDERRRLSFLEVAHLWESCLALEYAESNIQMELLLKYRKAGEIPTEVKEFYAHFCREELAHSLMFAHALRHFRAPPFVLDVGGLIRQSKGLKWIGTTAVTLLQSWFLEAALFDAGAADGIHPIAREIALQHHVDKARHIQFGREVVAGFWGSQPAAERDNATARIADLTASAMANLTIHPDVLSAMKFELPALRDSSDLAEVTRQCGYRVERNRRVFGDVFSFMRETGIYRPSTEPLFSEAGLDVYLGGTQSESENAGNLPAANRRPI